MTRTATLSQIRLSKNAGLQMLFLWDLSVDQSGPMWNITCARKLALRLRKDLDLFANLRPALVFNALVDASTLKPEIVKGLDILIVRELTGGVYFGEPRGIEDLPDGQRRGFNTQTYTTSEIERISRVAFDLARKRDGRVTSCEKSNVMESGKLWKEVITELHEREGRRCYA